VVRAALSLPPGEEPLAMTPLGDPDEKPAPTARKPAEELFEYR
jgi:nitroreductase